MKTLTEKQLRAYQAGCRVISKVEIADADGVLQNWTDADGRGLNFISRVSWGEDDESPMMSGECDVYWHHTEWQNLSPFNTANSRYAGWMHDGWPVMVYSEKTVPQGADPDDYAFVEVFQARVDNFDLSKHPGKIQFRERKAAELMDNWITRNTRFGANDGTKDVEDVMVDIITTFDKTSPQHVLEVPVATLLQVKRYIQQKQPILLALRVFAMQLGWDLRTKWHAASSSWRLTLYEPDRTTVTPVHTFPADAIVDYGEFSYSVEHVRNAVRVFYGSTEMLDDLGNDLRTSIVRTAETTPAHDLAGTPVPLSSIAKRGWRYMEFAEGASSLVQTAAQATAMADAALADLADPTVLMGCRLGYVFSAIEINDFIRLNPDGFRFSTALDLAVRGYQHVVSGENCYTELMLQGKPGLGRGLWTAMEARPGKSAPNDDLAPEAPNISVSVGAFGAKVSTSIPPDRDYDQVLFYKGETSDFVPSALNLVQSGRQLAYVDPPEPNGATRYYKVRYRDRHGNYSDFSVASDVTYQLIGFDDYIAPYTSLPLGTMSSEQLITVEESDGTKSSLTLGSLSGPVICSYSRAAAASTTTFETVLEIPWLPVWDDAKFAFFLVRGTGSVAGFEVNIEVDGTIVFGQSRSTLGATPIYPELTKITVPIVFGTGWRENESWVAQLKMRITSGVGNIELEGWGLLRKQLPQDFIEAATFNADVTLAGTETYTPPPATYPVVEEITSTDGGPQPS